MSKLNPYYGAIEVYNDGDWFGSQLDLSKLPKVNFWQGIQYNQDEVSKSSCTEHSSLTCLSNTVDKKISLAVRKALRQEALKQGAIEGVGWYIYKAVDLVRNWRNRNNPDNKISTFRVPLGSKLFWELIKKGYMANGGYKGGPEYIKDKYDDCAIDTVDDTGLKKITYGHSISFVWIDGNLYNVDNYFGKKKCNLYKVENIEKLVKNGVYFRFVYFWIPNELLVFKPDVMLPIHIRPDQVNAKRRGIVYAWEQEMKEAIRKGIYYPLFKNYVDGLESDIIARMLIDLANYRFFKRKGLKK